MLIMSSTVLLIIADCFHLYMLEIIRKVFLFLILLEEKILSWKGMASIMKNCTLSDLYSDAPWTPIITCILTEVGLLMQVPCVLSKVVA